MIGTVIICSYCNFIDKTITGTLLGGIFGYSLKGTFDKS